MAKGSLTRGRIFAIFVPVVVVLVALDQVTKLLARENLVQGQPVTVIPHLFNFELVYNGGAAFGSFGGATAYFVVVAVLICAGIIAYLVIGKQHRVLEVALLALITGGAIGNCADRLFQDGLVTDFIATSFIDFPVFNVADICVTCGCILFFIYYLFLNRSSAKQEQGDEEASEDNRGQ